MASAPVPLRVLVLGGSYGGLGAALNLLDLCNGKPTRFSGVLAEEKKPVIPVQIKVVDERDGYYHIISSPLALASKDFAAKAWQRFADLPALRDPGISWIQGSTIKVDCERKVATISDRNTGKDFEERYDYLIAATGLRRAWPVVPQTLTKDEYLIEAGNHIDAVRNAKEGVVVIGGGAVGIEMASELKLCQPKQTVTLIHSRERLLSSEPLPDEFKDRSLIALEESGVKVILGLRVTDSEPVETADGSPLLKLTLSNGSQINAGHVIKAISKSVPTSTYLDESLLDTDGYVKVEPSLNFAPGAPNAKYHFAIGDLAKWSGIKRCGGAFHMGSYAAINIHQQLLEKMGVKPNFVALDEYPAMIALAVGKQAVLYGPDDGTTWGRDKMEMMFGEDLGWTICWNYMKLGVDPSESIKSM
ncbi:FAD protein [Coleophoma crateriformis]|uniref:FAD protein n=1 Tax=Coleophoma crateriformis TaxID=565419 RepID=A0A3D8RW46_9HELO|nr:FAD protein [Coleophoma crateriformis]